jgi:hypothetical protein
MISSFEHRLIEHRVRVARAERLGPHFAELVPLQHRVRVVGAELWDGASARRWSPSAPGSRVRSPPIVPSPPGSDRA